MSAKKRNGKGKALPFAPEAASAPAESQELKSSHEPRFKVDGSEVPVDENGFPEGSTLQRKLDGMRRGAGIPTQAEYEEAQKNPPPPAERRLVLGLAYVGLMAVASRASNTMNEILEKDGDSEALRNGSYGLLFLNLAGGLGSITFAVRPGAVRWVFDMCDEAAASMGSVLIALALVMMIDPAEIYLQNGGQVPRSAILVVALCHVVIKNTQNKWIETYVHMVAHVAMAVVLNLAMQTQDTKLIVGAVCHGLAYLFKATGSLQDAVRLHAEFGPEELSAVLLTLGSWVLSECMIDRYQIGSGLY